MFALAPYLRELMHLIFAQNHKKKKKPTNLKSWSDKSLIFMGEVKIVGGNVLVTISVE